MRSRTSMVASLLTYQAKVFDGSTTYYFSAKAESLDSFKNKVMLWYAENVDSVKAYSLEYPELTNAGSLALPIGATLIKL